MTAMILAAGFGTRLAPLTDSLPKALIPVAGRAMLDRCIDRLAASGCSRIVINAHHHLPMMREHVRHIDTAVEIILSEEEEILGTGGGVLHAMEHLRNEPYFIVHNVDIASDFDLANLVDSHTHHRPLATLAVMDRKTSRGVLFDADGQFLGKEVWYEDAPPPEAQYRYGFCGIHVVSREIFDLGYEHGFSDIFDVYRFAMRNGMTVRGVECRGNWFDLGTKERIDRYEKHLAT